MHTWNRLDDFFSGRWWWGAARRLAVERLARVLDQHGDVSFATRSATERVRELEFAVRYLRPADPPVPQVVDAAEHQGVPRTDLQLMVLNRDLRFRNGRAEVRRSLAARVLTAMSVVVIVAQWTLLCAMAITAPGSLWLKAVVVVAISAVYAVLWRGWSLYTTRPIAALKRSGPLLENLCQRIPSAGTVHDIKASIDTE